MPELESAACNEKCTLAIGVWTIPRFIAYRARRVPSVRTDTSPDSQGTRHFTMLRDASALKTFPPRGSVANGHSSVWPSRSVRLNSDLNCRKIGSGNCPDDCTDVAGSTATAALPSTHDRSRISLDVELVDLGPGRLARRTRAAMGFACAIRDLFVAGLG
jgi:hypothetical protein